MTLPFVTPDHLATADPLWLRLMGHFLLAYVGAQGDRTTVLELWNPGDGIKYQPFIAHLRAAGWGVQIDRKSRWRAHLIIQPAEDHHVDTQ